MTDHAYHDADLDTRAPMDLSIRELRVLHRALKAHRKKLERERDRSTFVPEPGRTNVTELTAAAALQLENRLRDLLHARFQELRDQGRAIGVVRIDG